jgi:hypothetical protein
MNPDSDKTAEISVLEELRKPWSASSLTTKQIQQRQDISDTKKLWDKVLEEFRTKKEKRVPKNSKELAATKGKEVDKSDQPFRFLDLPAEIRNAIYDMSLEDDNEARERRKRSWDPAQSYPTYSGGYGSRGRMLFYSYRNSDEHKCNIGPTPEQKKHEEELRALLNQISRNRIRNGVYTTGCPEAFDKYKAEHGMYSRRCAHENYDREEKEEEEEEHDEKRDTEHIIPINARGNICGDVPMLSLVNRQLFQDTFYLYFSELREGMWFRWTIWNLDFFPFLRFMQNLRQPPYPTEILPAQVHVKYDDTDKGRDRVLHKRKFEHVKRLIDLHWLQGFPLWGCLIILCDTRCYNSPLGELLYSVRQIVALYRVQHDAWQKWSI